MNRSALLLFARLRRRRRLWGRLALALLVSLSVGLALDIYYHLLPQTKDLARQIQQGSLAVADLDQLKHRAKELEANFDTRRHSEAQRMIFDDVDAVSGFINALSGSLKAAGFIVHTNVAHLPSAGFDAVKLYGQPLQLIRVDLNLRNPAARRDAYAKLIDILKRIPDMGRKADLTRLEVKGSGTDFASVTMQLVLWSSFHYGQR